MHRMSANVDQTKDYVIQIKKGITVNVGVIVKNSMIRILAKMVICRFLVHLSAYKINKYLDIERSCKKRLTFNR